MPEVAEETGQSVPPNKDRVPGGGRLRDQRTGPGAADELAGGLDGTLYTAHAAKKRGDNRCELTLFAVQPL